METRLAKQNNAFILVLSNGAQWNSWDNNVIVVEKKIPIFADIIENQEKMLGADGLYDFGSEFENAIIELDVVVKADSIDNRIAKVAEIARLLNPKNGFQKIIFGDRPNVYYMVKVNSAMQQDFIQNKGLSYFTISLNAQPYAYKSGTSASFSGNGMDGIEMLLDTKTDADVPFTMEIGGDVNIKPTDFWDAKGDSKNILPNPRFQKNTNGDVVKWTKSKEYNSEEDFYKLFGFKKAYPTYEDNQTDFINKIKDGSYTATDFTIKIDYNADASGYLVRNYHYLINGYEVYKTTDNIIDTNWLGAKEYYEYTVVKDIVYVFKIIFANKIAISSYLTQQSPYFAFKLLDSFNYGDKDNTWFLNNKIEKTLKIENNVLILNDFYCNYKEHNIQLKELGVKEYFKSNKTYKIYDVLLNGVLVERIRRNVISQAQDLVPSFTNDLQFILSRSSSNPGWCYSILHDFGLDSFNADFIEANFASSGNAIDNLAEDTGWSQFWTIKTDKIIQKKNVLTGDIGTIDNNTIKMVFYPVKTDSYVNYYAILFVNNIIAGFAYVGAENNGDFIDTQYNTILALIKKFTDARGIINSLTKADIQPQIAGIGDIPAHFQFTINNNTIQTPTADTGSQPNNTYSWYDISPKLQYIQSEIGMFASTGETNVITGNTINIDFPRQTYLNIPNNHISFTFSPYYSDALIRYRYIYSNIITINDALNLDKDYVLSAYFKGKTSQVRFGIIVLDNSEVFKCLHVDGFGNLQDWTRQFFAEHLSAADVKIVVFIEAINVSHSDMANNAYVCLPQLEISPLTAFTENSALYNLDLVTSKNLINNAGFKFSDNGVMDRWGWQDGSAGMFTKVYSSSDLPQNSGSSLGYGVIEVSCQDGSGNSYTSYLNQTVTNIKELTTYTLSAYLKLVGDLNVNAGFTIIQKDANSAILDSKTQDFYLGTDWKLYSFGITTVAGAVFIEIRIEFKKGSIGLSGPGTIKVGAVQFEQNSLPTKWEDDNWNTSYVVASKNLIYNPALGVVSGKNLPDGWIKEIESPTGLANTITEIKTDTIAGEKKDYVRFNLQKEDNDNIKIWLKSKPFAVNAERYYAVSLYARGKDIIQSAVPVDYIFTAQAVKIEFLDTNGVIIDTTTKVAGITASTDLWGRYQLDFMSINKPAPTGAVSCVISLCVTNLSTVQDRGYIDFALVQVEEVADSSSVMTAWADNYTFTVKPAIQHSVLKPVYITNPKIYRQDGTLFFAWKGKFLNTEKIVMDTEKYQAYVIKEDGTKVNILDSVFVYIYNRLQKQILDTDRMYLRYVDESGNDANIENPVAVVVKFDWTARTF
ncbi:phage tail domain-containing protein [Clostridium sp. JN-9]|uniref:phage tail domain-containing protein n=1 Tax=Clostridium sp. JN-9 TaxID=2507159 RepID=UPI000FFE040A|nr:phage tail domain-containing protein [Clostridium sp. JN-9]QAT39538.1 hypothetical protein EQM05_04325 [Clostridium sp. JN-9]